MTKYSIEYCGCLYFIVNNVTGKIIKEDESMKRLLRWAEKQNIKLEEEE